MTLRQKIGLALLRTKATNYLPAPIVRSMAFTFNVSHPLFSIDNPQMFVKMGYNESALIYQIVSFIAGKAAAMDYGVRIYKNGELKDSVTAHPLIDLLYNPNPLSGKYEFLEQLYGYYLITGNTYVYAPRLEMGANMGQSKELYVMPAQFTRVRVNPVDGMVDGYDVENAGIKQYAATDVMHVKMSNLTFENGEAYYGQSPLRAAWRILSKSNANEEAANSMFKNLGIAGILTDRTKEAEYLTQEQLDTMTAKFNEKLGGQYNAGKIWMTNRDMNWQSIGVSPVDLALIQDYELNLRILCGVYKVSSTLFNDTAASTYNNVKEARKAAYTDAILPTVNAFCDSFNKWIAQSYAKDGEYLEIYPITDNIPELQADKKELADWLNVAWWLQFNEKREAMGFDPDPKMDNKYLVPSSLLDVEDINPPFEV